MHDSINTGFKFFVSFQPQINAVRYLDLNGCPVDWERSGKKRSALLRSCGTSAAKVRNKRCTFVSGHSLFVHGRSYTVHCTMYRCTVRIAQNTDVQCALHNIRMYSVHCTMYRCTMRIAQYTDVQCALHSAVM